MLQLKAELLIKECKIVAIAKLKKVGMSKPIRDPTHLEDPTEIDLKPIDPIILAVDGEFSPPINQLRRVGFSFCPPKLEKPELTGEKPRFRREKLQNPVKKT